MIDLEKLRERANAANTAEQWYSAHDMTSCSYDYDKAFIAACSPSVVIELLDHIAQLEKDAGRYRDLREGRVKNTYVTRYIGGATVPVYKGQALDALIDAAMEAKHG